MMRVIRWFLRKFVWKKIYMGVPQKTLYKGGLTHTITKVPVPKWFPQKEK